jgi:hypothetical protein
VPSYEPLAEAPYSGAVKLVSLSSEQQGRGIPAAPSHSISISATAYRKLPLNWLVSPSHRSRWL